MKVFEGIENFGGISAPVLTIGTFDGVHVGHQHIIRQMNNEADKIGGQSTLLTFHPHPRGVINPNENEFKLILTLEEKLEKLASVGMQNVIIHPFDRTFSSPSAQSFIEQILINKINAYHLFIGYDHRFGNSREGDIDLLKTYSKQKKFKLTEISAVEVNQINVSSTKIRKALISGDITYTNTLLNGLYCVSGIVEPGMKMGRTLNFPTANIGKIDKSKLLPKNGVYAGKITFDNQIHNAIFNLGIRPTVQSIDNQPKLEAHLINFNGDLYGKSVCVFFQHRLRDERKFSSVTALKNQIRLDENLARTLLCSH